MAETKIQWTGTPRADGTIAPGYTFNPWMGCQKVSPGCANCYAETLMDTRYKKVRWGPNGTRVRTTPEYWMQPHKWQRAAAAAGERRKVFCASLADVFEGRDDLVPWRKSLWPLIVATPNLDWLLLTKRPENVRLMYPRKWLKQPPHNVWLGTSVEDQERYAKRIMALVGTRAAVHFLSCEPLIGPLSLGYSGVDWVIVGGESGATPRMCSIRWIEDLIAECRDVGVACFVKQLGSNVQIESSNVSGWRLDFNPHDEKCGDPSEWPTHLRVRQWPEVCHA